MGSIYFKCHEFWSKQCHINILEDDDGFFENLHARFYRWFQCVWRSGTTFGSSWLVSIMMPIGLNLMKCYFYICSGMLLGNIISTNGVMVDLAEVFLIMMAPTPKTPKELSQFLDQVSWHSRNPRYLAHVAIGLNVEMK